MPYFSYIEKIIKFYTQGENPVLNTSSALETFQKLTGKYCDSDPWYEERSNLFIDYLAFDYSLGDMKNIVHKYFIDFLEKIKRDGLVSLFRGMLATNPSVFKVKKHKRNKMILMDLIGSIEYEVMEPEIGFRFEKGTIINARIIPFCGKLILGRGIVLHPEEASFYIIRLIEDLRDSKLLSWQSYYLLARMKLLSDTSPSLKLSTVYTIKSFLINKSI